MHPRYWYFLFALTVSSKSLHGQAKIRRIEVPTLPRTMPLPKTISFFKILWVKVFFSKVLRWAQIFWLVYKYYRPVLLDRSGTYNWKLKSKYLRKSGQYLHIKESTVIKMKSMIYLFWDWRYSYLSKTVLIIRWVHKIGIYDFFCMYFFEQHVV